MMALFLVSLEKGWLFLAKNIPSLIISGYVCHKYPLQRDIFCLAEALLLV
jgi:hypothetical protein